MLCRKSLPCPCCGLGSLGIGLRDATERCAVSEWMIDDGQNG